MQTKNMRGLIAAILASGLQLATSRAATTINAVNHYAYGANIGWMDGRGNIASGAVMGEYVCSGNIYSANAGWINLGTGFPTNGIQYRNLATNDFGVNLDSLGYLSGYAYGANIGWIVFTNGSASGPLSATDWPRVNMASGKLSGYAYSANCGWISLSNAAAFVQTDKIAPGADLNGDGIPDAWEIQNFGTANINVNADADGDGVSNLQEYYAGTNPKDSNDYLHITYVARGDLAPNFTTLHWTSVPTRFYTIQYRQGLDAGSPWADSIGYGFGAGSSTFNTGHTNAFEFYRIRAYRPLGP
jgi:hypothetical protein